jgi:hypoxanthine phosphoribosyltransferase
VKNLKLLKNREEISQRIEKLATEIMKDFKNQKVLFIGILKGAFIFVADLIRKLELELEVDFIEISSYGHKTETSGKVKIVHGINVDITDKNVIIIEDIVDTGHTMSFLINYLKKKGPKSLKLCVLMSKPSQREIKIHFDYLGFKVPNKFIVGYGLDYKGRFRELPEIYYKENLDD